MDIILDGLNEHDKTDGLQMFREELDDVKNHLKTVSIQMKQIQGSEADGSQVVQQELDYIKSHLQSVSAQVRQIQRNQTDNTKSMGEDAISVLELHTLRSNVESINQSVTMLQQQLQSQSVSINSQQLDDEIIAIKTNLQTIEANCNQLFKELDNKVAKEEIDTLKSNFSVIVKSLTKVEAVLIQMQESQGNTVQYSEELSNQISQMENLRQDVNLIQVHMDQMSQDISSRATVADVRNLGTSVSGLRTEVTSVVSEVEAINQRINTLRQGIEDNSEYINTLMQGAEDNSRHMSNVVTKGELQSMVATLKHNYSDILSQARGNFSDIRQRLVAFNREVDLMGEKHKTMIADFLNLHQEFAVLQQQQEEQEQTGSDVIIGQGDQWTGSAALGQLLRNVSMLNHGYRTLNASHGVIQVDLDSLKQNSAQLITDVSDLQRDRDHIRNDIRAIRYDLDQVRDNIEDIR